MREVNGVIIGQRPVAHGPFVPRLRFS
jgi:hypothetical protein